jgi:hypothetical protein
MQASLRRRCLRLSGIAGLVAVSGCGVDGIEDVFGCDADEYETPVRLRFSDPSVALLVGETAIVLTSALNSRGQFILCYHGTQTTTSTNTAVFDVDTGPLRGVGPGTAFLKVTLGTLADSIPVTVSSRP